MSRWGAQLPHGNSHESLQKSHNGNGNDHAVERVSLDFLPVEGKATTHHEPPKFESRPKVGLVLDKVGHAAFHYARFLLTGDMRDYGAYMAQSSEATEAEMDRLEAIKDNPELMRQIQEEIRRRR